MKKKLIGIVISIMLIACIFSITPVISSGTQIYVDANAPPGGDGSPQHPFQHIQDGINAVASNGTVHVLDGTYYEMINITKPLSLIGQNEKNTIIDAKNNNWYEIVDLLASFIEIQNFSITNGSVKYPYCDGIDATDLSHFKNIHIANCTITHNYCGISCFDIYNCSILNCVIFDSTENGIAIAYDSHNITIFNCSIYNSGSTTPYICGNDIFIQGDTNQISNISISYSNLGSSWGYGIVLEDLKNGTIFNNSINNNYYGGIYLTIKNNDLVIKNITIWNNTIFKNGKNGSPDHDQNGILIEAHLKASNITIRNNNISNNSENEDYGNAGICIRTCQNKIIIKNNTFYANYFGIWIESSEHIQVVNNNILHGKGTLRGIGICLMQSSSFNNLTNNTIAYNHRYGIYILGAGSSNNNTIYGNTIIDNNNYGIIFDSSATNSVDNVIYHNNIINNTYANAYDLWSNHWDNGYPSGGNFWDDYNGVDEKSGPSQDQSGSDGIGDTHYTFQGGNDRYPLMEPIYHPTLNFPPLKPHKPDGPLLINKNVNYVYSTSTIDVNNDQVYYYWDWGDGTNSGWIGPANSGETYGTYHQWSQMGLYNIKVKAKDIPGEESNWSDPRSLVVILLSDFSISPSQYVQPNQMIYFNDQSQSYFPIVSFRWDFGDNSPPSFSHNPSHTYTKNGRYDVSLMVTDNKSNNNISHHFVYIDSVPPKINSVNNTPDTVGFGFNVTISANVTDNLSGVKAVTANITYPDHTHGNYTMSHITGNTYQYVFNNTWRTGQYNYTIWAMDNSNNSNSSTGHHFHVSTNATISISTLKDSYTGNQFINLTDPPNLPENLTLVNRGLTWNTFYNASSGSNILETYQGPVNYQGDNGSWTPINTSLSQLTSDNPAYNYGYRTGNNRGLFGVYFKPNAQNDWPVAFTYNKSNNPTTYVVRSKLVGVGYVDPQSNWAYQYLQNVQSSQGQFTGNSATYKNVFTGTDVTWSYDNAELKEAIIMSNATKTALQNHPPSQYGLHDASSYLVFITKLDCQSLSMYNKSGMLTGNVTISDTGVDFKDALGFFKCALPLGESYELNNESIRQKLTYRIIQYNGNTYLLSGLKVSDLTAMTFPVVIDPTLTVYSTSSDGYIYNSGTNYNTIWTASTGTVNSSATYITIGQNKGGTSVYYIYRGFVFFNTSSLPSNAYLDSATLSLYKKDDYSTKDFDITIQNGQPTYPHDPLQSGDYNKNDYSGNGGTLNTSRFSSGYNPIPLTNLSLINRNGTTKLCLRSSRDINGNTPTGNEYVDVYSHENQGIGSQPKLVIVYRNQSKIKNIGSTSIKGYLLIQIQFYSASQGQWLLDKDTIDETSLRTINNGDQLALDRIFNNQVRASDLTHGTGTYRVYAAFRDPTGKILKTNDGVELKAWWQFSKT